MKDKSQTQKNKQPNSLNCFACGVENETGLKMRFYEIGENALYARHRVPSRFEGFPGIVHGGIVASMLDEMVSRVTMIGEPNRFRMTAKLEIRYRQPVPSEEDLELFATLTRSRGRISFAKAELRLPDGSIASEAEAILVAMDDLNIPPEQLADLGWKVYPDEKPLKA